MKNSFTFAQTEVLLLRHTDIRTVLSAIYSLRSLSDMLLFSGGVWSASCGALIIGRKEITIN